MKKITVIIMLLSISVSYWCSYNHDSWLNYLKEQIRYWQEIIDNCNRKILNAKYSIWLSYAEMEEAIESLDTCDINISELVFN